MPQELEFHFQPEIRIRLGVCAKSWAALQKILYLRFRRHNYCGPDCARKIHCTESAQSINHTETHG